MGVVLQAVHVELGQRVAIKLMLRELATHPECVARFMREARAAARLQNEHVVRVTDVSRLDSGEPYMVMEYLSGRDLSDVLEKEGPQPIAATVDRILQSCEALAEAHTAGIVHRDLKPANLFLVERPDGSSVVKVLDFGISKAVGLGDAQEPAVTATNSLLGSPAYMSPEQIRSAKYVDARTDLWALGVTLYELLTSCNPFESESMVSLIARIAVDSPDTLRVRRPDVPPDLERAIFACLEKDPARRPQTVADLARAFVRFGTPEAAASLRRIHNASRESGTAGRTVPILRPEPSPLAIAPAAPVREEVPQSTLGNTVRNRPNKVWKPLVLATILALVAAVVVAVRTVVPSASPPPADSAADLVPASPRAEEGPTIPQSATPASPTGDRDEASSSASAAHRPPPATLRTTARTRATAAKNAAPVTVPPRVDDPAESTATSTSTAEVQDEIDYSERK